jgi:predicted anti-sigma-YlaC factor YlaD
MDCVDAREALSAMMDGEEPGAAPGDVAVHLAGCAECRSWREAAHDVTRRARLHLAQPSAPAGVDAVLAAVRSQGDFQQRPRTAPLTRLGLVVVGLAQVALALGPLLSGRYGGAPGHVSHEIGSFTAALAVGFLAVAWRPGRALGLRMSAGVAAVLLMITAIADLASHQATLGDEAPHLLALAGWLLVRHLAAVTPPPTGESPSPAPARLLRWIRRVLRERSLPRAALTVMYWPAAARGGSAPGPAGYHRQPPVWPSPGRERRRAGEPAGSGADCPQECVTAG